jgi:pseudouridine kinase
MTDTANGSLRHGYAVAVGASTCDITGTRLPAVTMRPYDAGAGRILFKRGGCARNVAENLARLGADCRLISVFGDDVAGRDIMERTEKAGVDILPSLLLPDMSTAICLILTGSDGNSFYSLADASIVSHLTPGLLMRSEQLLDEAALIVSNTYPAPETLRWLFTRHGDRPLFIDTIDASHAGRIRPWLSRIHTLKPNRAEASLLSGLPFESRAHAPPIADWFHRAGVVQVVLSLGEFGLYYSNGEHAGWMDPLPVKVVNVTGAGDALLSGLAYGWLAGLPFVETVRFANACAALTLTCEDNNHPRLAPDRVRAILRRPPATRPGAPFQSLCGNRVDAG